MKNNFTYLPGALSVLLFSAFLVLNSCKKISPGERDAKGSLENEKGNCLPATVHGTWYDGVAPDADTNYVEIGVNVTRTGNYRIVSNLLNGVQFADSGVFTATGLQTVRLKAAGTFTNPTTTVFTISFDNSLCGFSVNVSDLPLGDNSWRFTARSHTYSGACGSQQYFLPNDLGSILDIAGPVASGEDTLFFIELGMPPDGYDVVPGTYNSNTAYVNFAFYPRQYANDPNRQIFLAGSDKPDKVMTVAISGFGTAKDGSRMILGSFSGAASDSTGAGVTISNGAFRVGGAPYPFDF